MQLNVGVRAKQAITQAGYSESTALACWIILHNYCPAVRPPSWASLAPCFMLYRPFKVPSSWAWTVLTGVFLRRSVSRQVGTTMWHEQLHLQLHLLELVLFWRFDSSWLCTSYLPSIATKHRLLPPFLLYFLSPPGRRYRLSPHHVDCLERAASIYSQLLRTTYIRHQEGARRWWFW